MLLQSAPLPLLCRQKDSLEERNPRLSFQLIYIEKYSVLLDIKLLIMTIKILFMRESTEGFSDEDSVIGTYKVDDNATSENKTEV